MLRPALLSALLATALFAGCSSPGGGPETVPAPATYTVTATSPPAVRHSTDTLHLLARPDLTSQPPTAQEPIRVPIDSIFGQTVSGAALNSFHDTWNLVLPQDVHGFAGNATLLVEVTGTLVSDPRADLQGGGCFWALGLTVGSFETGDFYDLGCVKQGSTVGPGLYTLAFPFTLADVAWSAGTDLHFEMHTMENSARAPGAAAELLTASLPYDSTIRVYGLELPLDPSLLAAT